MEEMKIIARVVMDYFSCAYDDLNCKDRHRHRVVARQIVMALTRKYTKLSLREIGEYFTRDHATAIYGVKKVEDLMMYKDFRSEYEYIAVMVHQELEKYRIEKKADEKKIKEKEMREKKIKERNQWKFTTTDPGLVNGFKHRLVAVI